MIKSCPHQTISVELSIRHKAQLRLLKWCKPRQMIKRLELFVVISAKLGHPSMQTLQRQLGRSKMSPRKLASSQQLQEIFSNTLTRSAPVPLITRKGRSMRPKVRSTQTASTIVHLTKKEILSSSDRDHLLAMIRARLQSNSVSIRFLRSSLMTRKNSA